MPNSQRFRQLTGRLESLRRHLLPRSFDPTGSYPEFVYDRARGYRLLAHAELEACLEDVVFNLATDSVKEWISTGNVSQVLLSLLAFCEGKQEGVPRSLPQTGPPELQCRIDRARAKFCSYVRHENHGLREVNILRLLLPVGVREVDIDRVWLNTIDSFGQYRGDVAHRSMKTVQPPDPLNEYQTVTQIRDGVKVIDTKLMALRDS